MNSYQNAEPQQTLGAYLKNLKIRKIVLVYNIWIILPNVLNKTNLISYIGSMGA